MSTQIIGTDIPRADGDDLNLRYAKSLLRPIGEGGEENGKTRSFATPGNFSQAVFRAYSPPTP